MKKVIECNFDNKRQHKGCQNINTCEMNPLSSRYKKSLESKRLEAIEEENLRAIDHDGENVICSKRNCKKFGNFETCHHGVPHEYSGSCMMRCERFTDAYCDIGGIGL